MLIIIKVKEASHGAVVDLKVFADNIQALMFAVSVNSIYDFHTYRIHLDAVCAFRCALNKRYFLSFEPPP